jgi:hypothetical protein
VFVRFGKILVVIALAATLGAHWVVLQTVAWTTMLADNLHSASLPEAFVKTFDGKHPCCLCKAIAAGKKSEKKGEFTLQMQKLEFPPVKANLVLLAPSQFELLPQMNFFSEFLTQKPLTPPPRAVFA